jgi:hypothetical protein
VGTIESAGSLVAFVMGVRITKWTWNCHEFCREVERGRLTSDTDEYMKV